MKLKISLEHFSPFQYISVLLPTSFCDSDENSLSCCDYCSLYYQWLYYGHSVHKTLYSYLLIITVCQWKRSCCDQCYQVTTVQEVSRHYHPQKGSPSGRSSTKRQTQKRKHVSCWRQSDYVHLWWRDQER